MKRIAQLVVCLFLLSFIPSRTIAQTPVNTNGSIKRDDSNLERNKILETAIISAWYENPMLYDIHRKALAGSQEAEVQLARMNTDKYGYEFFRMIPGPVGEKGILDWESRKNDFNSEMRKEMNTNYDELASNASKVRSLLFNPKASNKNFNLVYDLSHSIEGTNKLPNAASLEALRQQYPDIAQRIEQGMSPQQIDSFCKGTMSIEDFCKIKKIDVSYYQTYVINNYFKVPTEKDLPQTLTSEKKAEIEKRLFEKHLDDMRGDFAGAMSILSLVDSKLAVQLSSLGKGVFDINEGLGKVQIDNALSLKNLGSIAGGIKTLVTLFGDNPTNQALMKILENQQKIITKLGEIDTKITVVQEHVNYLIELTRYNQQAITNNLSDIKNRLARIEGTQESTKALQRRLFQESAVSKIQNSKIALIKRFENNLGTKEWVLYFTHPGNPRYLSSKIQDYNTALDNELQEIAAFIKGSLNDPQSSTFNDMDEFGQLSVPQVIEKRKLDISDRISLLRSAGPWLSAHTGGKEPLVYFSGLTKSSKPADLSDHIPNPSIFTCLTVDYINLASYRLPKKTSDGNLPEFCSNLNTIYSKTIRMQENVPLAFAVLNLYLRKLKSEQEDYVLKRGRELQLNFFDEGTRTEKIWFGNYSREEIINSIMSMNNANFEKMAMNMGIIVKNTISRTEEEKTTISWNTSRQSEHDKEIVVKKLVYQIDELSVSPNLMFKYQSRNLPPLENYKTVQTFTREVKIGAQLIDKGTAIVPVDNKFRKPYAEVIADEVISRQESIGDGWKQNLISNSDQYLADIYRSMFLVETLLEGGFGPSYSYNENLAKFTNSLNEAHEILSFIESQWYLGKNVLLLSNAPVVPVEVPIQGDGVATAYHTSYIDDFRYKYVSNCFDLYFEHRAKFIPVSDKDRNVVYYRSMAPDMPDSMESLKERKMYLGHLEDAIEALKWGNQFPDLELPVGCLSKFP